MWVAVGSAVWLPTRSRSNWRTQKGKGLSGWQYRRHEYRLKAAYHLLVYNIFNNSVFSEGNLPASHRHRVTGVHIDTHHREQYVFPARWQHGGAARLKKLVWIWRLGLQLIGLA